MAKTFWDVKGIDISKEATDFARKKLGLTVKTGDFLLENLGKKYDIFCMWDTIEHLSRPDKYIKKISSNIKKDGIICITTGNVNSLLAKINGSKWRLINPKIHLYYFSKKTITLLLKNNGFEVVEIKDIGYHRSIGQIMYSLLTPNERFGRKIYDALNSRQLFEKKDIYLNTYDVMFVIARKV